MQLKKALLGLCVASCLAVACGDDDDDGVPSTDGGTAGKAGSAAGGSNGGTKPTGGAAGKAGDDSGGMANGGMTGGVGGEAGEPAATGFSEFVHQVIANDTAEDNAPAVMKGRTFGDPRDERGHYLVRPGAFDDLF